MIGGTAFAIKNVVCSLRAGLLWRKGDGQTGEGREQHACVCVYVRRYQQKKSKYPQNGIKNFFKKRRQIYITLRTVYINYILHSHNTKTLN